MRVKELNVLVFENFYRSTDLIKSNYHSIKH